MIEFLISRYFSYKGDDVELIKQNIDNPEYISNHLVYLERRYKRFTIMYRVRSMIVKFIPILSLFVYMIYPAYYIVNFSSLIFLIVCSELVAGYFFPRVYFEKIHSNITILKSILRAEE